MTAAAGIRPATVLGLVAGRGAFRLTQYAVNIALLATWGATGFDRYAAAVGATSWLVSLGSAGPEKAALTLLPRARRTAPAIVGLLVALAVVVPAVVVAGALAVVAVTGVAGIGLTVAAGAIAVLWSGNLVLVGLHRATGRPRRDAQTFGVFTVTQVLVLALVLVADLPPAGYLATVGAILAVANLILLDGLGRPSLAILRRPWLTRQVARAAVLMATYEVCSSASVSLLFVVLALTSHADQSAELYLVTAGWSIAVGALFYLFRVYQPQVSARLAGRGGGSGRDQAVRLTRWAVGLQLVWTAPAAAVVLLATRDGWTATVGLLAALLASRIPVFLLMSTAGYLLENVDAGTLRTAAGGSVLGLAAVAVLAVVCVPAAGAVGALFALSAKELTQGLVVLRAARGWTTAAGAVPAGAR